MTVIYEVTAIVRDDLIETYEQYMRSRHIPDLLATGSFVGASFWRSEDGRYRMCYEAATQEDLDEYLNRHAEGLRADLRSRFPDGVKLSREVWNVIEKFDRAKL